jgi:hypothetical protein
MSASYDVYLVLQRFRDNVDRYRTLVEALRPVGAEYLPAAEGFYQASTDCALVALSFSPHAVTHLGEDSLHLLAHRSRLPMIVPACLDGAERRRFFREQLCGYEVHVEPGPVAEPAERVIELLARRVPVLAETMALREHGLELPLFQPWWQRQSAPDLSSC